MTHEPLPHDARRRTVPIEKSLMVRLILPPAAAAKPPIFATTWLAARIDVVIDSSASIVPMGLLRR